MSVREARAEEISKIGNVQIQDFLLRKKYTLGNLSILYFFQFFAKAVTIINKIHNLINQIQYSEFQLS